MEKSLKFLNVSKGYDESSIKELSPLALAFLGDSVYELLVRTVVLNKNKNPKKLHIETINYVKASSQANFIEELLDILTEEELLVFKRGRNAKSHTVPKNQSISDYRNATGLECLFGYLYLLDKSERILELFEMITESQKVKNES